MKQQAPRKDLRNPEIGAKYGRLTVVACCGQNIHRQVIWLFRCECGRERERSASAVVNGVITQCGFCAAKNRAAQRTIHRERDAFIVQARMNGLPCTAIARDIGITPSTVYSAIDRAKRRGLLGGRRATA